MIITGVRVLRAGGVSVVVRPRTVLVCLILFALAGALAVLLLGTGSLRLTPAQVMAGLSGHAEDPIASRVLQRIRLPRVLTAAMVGAALGMAGAVFQSLSRNALGSPDIIGDAVCIAGQRLGKFIGKRVIGLGHDGANQG